MRLLRRGGLAGPDGPYRLVGDDPVGERLYADLFDDGIQLTSHHLFGDPLLPLLQYLTDTQDGPDTGGSGSGKLRRHLGVAFTEQGTTLRMPHDDIAALEIQQHGGGDLSGVGTGGMLADVLRTKGHRAIRQLPSDIGQIDEGRADHHFRLFDRIE